MVAARDSGEEGSMGQRFEITSMRVGGWLRLHDTETGERFEVPMNVNTTPRPGRRRAGPARGQVHGHARRGGVSAGHTAPERQKKRRKSSSRKRRERGHRDCRRTGRVVARTDPSSPWAPASRTRWRPRRAG
jgi:hypothetical protein